jgi:hypothetical protein
MYYFYDLIFLVEMKIILYNKAKVKNENWPRNRVTLILPPVGEVE